MSDKVLSVEKSENFEKQFKNLVSGTVDVIPQNEFREKLINSVATGKPLKIKLGLDPTAPDIHLGHTVVLNKLRQFQDYGHNIQIVIGDFTARIGDPTGKSEARVQLDEKEVKKNAKTYFDQFRKVLNMDKVQVFYNAEWFSKLNFEESISLSSKITVARLLERNDFENRYRNNLPISLHEFFYPLMQGYDSVVLESDIEIGGTDQHFNLLMGRHLQESYQKSKQVILTLPLLEGLDGVEKMSKSKGNYISLEDTPNNMFGKLMSIPDELIVKYFKLLTPIDIDKVNEIELGLQNQTLHPKECKMNLAETIVSIYYTNEIAKDTYKEFNNIFKKNLVPEDMPEYNWTDNKSINIVELVHQLNLLPSKTQIRNMINNNGIKVNSVKIDNVNQIIEVENNMIIQIGKRKFIRLITD
ncbi:tyrosine--tRNA ligase [Mammaliicoccus sciuri]|uniref:tyrosine--tRNA ligase n=1 Tax=Mammaliicoccus sciuri TaxID=1296 RepID=UPI001E5B31B1|nr:tyrosine--tRNA ligase [Mammaliicoccus sciuri]MCD8898175.1 tyrosine--tRNA ligase [Mammaliicoccus sciuri]